MRPSDPVGSVPQGNSYWVSVLLESWGIHSVHCVAGVTPPDNVWGIPKREEKMRSVFVQAYGVEDALERAFQLGILEG
jgi:hypothetical protein